MVMTNGAKVVTALALGVGGWLMLSGSASAKGRGPYTDPIVVPGRDGPWDPVDEALCLCSEAGERNVATLAICVLQRLYPEVGSWPAMKDDHPTVHEAQQVITTRASAFVAALKNGQDPCKAVVIDPIPAVFVPGFGEPNNPGSIDPFFGKTMGSLFTIEKNGTPAATVGKAYQINANSHNIQRGLWCMNACGFNLYFYSRPRDAGSYGAVKLNNGKWYDIGTAWFPEHTSLRAAADMGVKATRQVSWSGKKLHAGTYGTPWIPEATMIDGDLHCSGDDPWDPARNPPQSVLDALQLGDLLTMRAVWEQNNP